MGNRLLHHWSVTVTALGLAGVVVAVMVMPLPHLGPKASLSAREAVAAAGTQGNPPSALTSGLADIRDTSPEERGQQVRKFMPELRAYLETPDSQGIVDREPDALPGVKFLLDQTDRMRVVSYDGGRDVGSVNRGYSYIQWWENGNHRLQPLYEGSPYLITDAAVVTGPGGRRLVMLQQLVQSPWTQSVVIMALGPQADRWTPAKGVFGTFPSRVGSVPVTRNDTTLSVPAMGANAGVIFLEEGGKALRVCETASTTCKWARWDGTKYSVQ